MRVRDRNDSVVDEETNLLGDVSRRASHDLSGEVSSEGNDLASNERVGALVASGAKSGTLEQGGEVESGQGVENDDLVSSISVDGLVEREVSRRVVVSLVKGRVGWGVGVGEACKPLLEETLALSSGDGRTRSVVVVEGQIVVVLVVDEVLLSEKTAEAGVAKSVGLVRAKLQHINDVGGSEVEGARNLRVESSKGCVESVVGELGGNSATDATTAGNVGVGADLVRSTRVVDGRVLDKDLDVDLVQVLRDTEETSSKVLSSLDHAVLRLGAEDGKSILLGEVVEELTVQLTVLNTKLEVLAATEGGKKLSTKLVGPVSQESQLTSDVEARSGGIADLLGESRRTSTASGVTSTVAVQKKHLVDGAALRDQGVGLVKTVVGRRDRVPGAEVTPVLCDVELVAESRRAVRLRDSQRESGSGSRVVRVQRSCLNSIGLLTSGGRSGEANLRLVREEGGVDLGCELSIDLHIRTMDVLLTASRGEDIAGGRAGNLGVREDTGRAGRAGLGANSSSRAGLGGRAYGADSGGRGHIGHEGHGGYVEQGRTHFGRVKQVSVVYSLWIWEGRRPGICTAAPSRSRQATADPPGHIRQLAPSTADEKCMD